MSKAGCEVTAGCGNSFQRIFCKGGKGRSKFVPEKNLKIESLSFFREYVVSEVDPVGLREDGIEQPE